MNETYFDTHLEASARRCSVEKMLLNILQNPQENTCIEVSFLLKAPTLVFCGNTSGRLSL